MPTAVNKPENNIIDLSIVLFVPHIANACLKGPFKYLVAKLHGCYPNAISLPVSQNIFARFFRRRPVADSSRS